eukprot:TRINITY_DN55683_c0_g1_i1.p3 TRINITY_DN55683_c0_g1~~TRINITY_DN55683_c0_g1_i1.p3  ORF type:complete len:100 (-),score=38.32 TRINITY_DN55683_c0_g1_i1:103-366(-)
MLRSLVGSEMCIRDRSTMLSCFLLFGAHFLLALLKVQSHFGPAELQFTLTCLVFELCLNGPSSLLISLPLVLLPLLCFTAKLLISKG